MQNLIAQSLDVDSSNLVCPDVVGEIPESTLIPLDDVDVNINIQADYAYCRSHLYRLMTKVEALLDNSVAVAEQTEHPRAFEVAGNLVKVASDVTEQLSRLNKSTQVLKGLSINKTSTVTTTNNSIFVGSTTELSAFLNNTTRYDDIKD